MEIADGVFFFRGRSGERLRPGAGSVNVVVVRGAALAMRTMTMMLVVLLHMEGTEQIRRTEISGRPAWERVD